MPKTLISPVFAVIGLAVLMRGVRCGQAGIMKAHFSTLNLHMALMLSQRRPFSVNLVNTRWLWERAAAHSSHLHLHYSSKKINVSDTVTMTSGVLNIDLEALCGTVGDEQTCTLDLLNLSSQLSILLTNTPRVLCQIG